MILCGVWSCSHRAARGLALFDLGVLGPIPSETLYDLQKITKAVEWLAETPYAMRLPENPWPSRRTSLDLYAPPETEPLAFQPWHWLGR